MIVGLLPPLSDTFSTGILQIFNFQSIILYFRFVVTPFGIPSVTDLLGDAFTAVTGRSVQGFEDYIQYLSSALSEVFGSEFFKDPQNRQKRSMDDISDPKLFGELKETAESVMNISSLTEMFNVDNLELGKGNLPPGSVLSLASVVGNTHHVCRNFLNKCFRYGHDCSIYLYGRRPG